MRSETEVDVAVLGAGPAGAFAAALLARRGLATVLIDAGRPQRKTSEWLSARGATELQLAGLGQVLVCSGAVPASRVVVHDGESLEPSNEPSTHWLGSEPLGHAWLLDRGRIDQALRDCALAHGCCIRSPWIVTDIVRHVSAFRIECRGLDGQRTLVATHVVDATGAGRRRWRPLSRLDARDPALCYQLWMTEERADGEPELRVLAAGARMCGYRMTGGGHRSVWALANERPLPWRNAATEFQRLARIFGEPLAQLPSMGGAMLAAWCLREDQVHGSVPGVLAIGDTAQVADVATGRGLEQALATASAAVHAIALARTRHRNGPSPIR